MTLAAEADASDAASVEEGDDDDDDANASDELDAVGALHRSTARLYFCTGSPSTRTVQDEVERTAERKR